MKALVTGGAGFLGTEIIQQLLQRGVAVRSLQRSDAPGLAAQGVEVITGDITEADVVERACQGCDVVFHVAAKAGVWGSYQEYYRPNVIGTRNVLNACRQNGIRHLIHTSSPSAVFDGRDEDGIDESIPYPDYFLSHYSSTKAQAERMVLAANGSRLATVALRPHLIWGPGDRQIFPRIISRARSGRLKLINNGGKLVDTTYITNAAHAHLLAWGALHEGGACAGKAYFISNAEPLPMAQIINRFAALVGLPPIEKEISPTLAYGIGIAMEVAYTVLGIKTEPFLTRFVAKQLSVAHWYRLDAARRDLGYTPLISFDEGLRHLAVALQGEYGSFVENYTG